jgi:DNA sulfur modification protein DndD
VKINKVRVKNFQPYKGDQEVTFSSDPNHKIILVFGDNMRGKTSLLNSIRWALYGKVRDRLGRDIGLVDLINSEAREAGDYKISVLLTFEADSDEYELSRMAEPDDLVARPKSDHQFRTEVLLRKNGQIVRADEIENHINRFIPEQISRFYLFDGELLDEYENLLTEDSSQAKLIKEAIEQILGVPALLNGRDEAKELLKRAQSLQAKENRHVSENQDYSNQSMRLQEENRVLAEDLKKLEEDKNKHQAEVEKIAAELDSLQPIQVLNQEMQSFTNQRNDSLSTLDRIKTERHELLRRAWRDLLQPRLQSRREFLQTHLSKQQQKIEDMGAYKDRLKRLESILTKDVCPTCEQSIGSEIKRKLGAEIGELEISIQSAERERTSASEASHELTTLSKITGTGAASQLAELERRENRCNLEITRCESEIEVREEKLRTHEVAQIARLQKRRDGLKELVGSINRDIKKATEEIEGKTARINQLSKLMSRNPQGRKQKSTREVEIYTELNQMFSTGIDVLRDRLRERVASEATAVFKELTTEPTFTGLQINPNYGLTILDRDGRQVTIRSAGAEQIVAMSLLGALNRSANRPGPIVVDTPFGRLDPKHRLNILKYIPHMGDQIIFLVHEGEIDRQRDLEPIKNYIGSAFEIKRITSSHSEIVRA